jgi:hypothetical protein
LAIQEHLYLIEHHETNESTMRTVSFLFVALAIALPNKKPTSRRQLMAGVK